MEDDIEKRIAKFSQDWKQDLIKRRRSYADYNYSQRLAGRQGDDDYTRIKLEREETLYSGFRDDYRKYSSIEDLRKLVLCVEDWYKYHTRLNNPPTEKQAYLNAEQSTINRIRKAFPELG